MEPKPFAPGVQRHEEHRFPLQFFEHQLRVGFARQMVHQVAAHLVEHRDVEQQLPAPFRLGFEDLFAEVVGDQPVVPAELGDEGRSRRVRMRISKFPALPLVCAASRQSSGESSSCRQPPSRPVREDVIHHFFDVIQIHFRLERIENAVIARVEQFLVVHFRVIAEMRVPCCFNKPMRHQRASGNDSFDQTTFDQIAKNETHLRYGQRAREGHYDETILVARHRLQNVGRIADLPACESRIPHRADQLVDGATLRDQSETSGATYPSPDRAVRAP